MIKPYILFNGNCKAVLAFYQAAFGSNGPMILPYGDYVPQGVGEAPEEEKA